VLLELAMLQEGSLQKGEGLYLAFGDWVHEFMRLSQKRILGHIKVETKKVY
jgi:hypothetical protein